jgi:hypothetical protein
MKNLKKLLAISFIVISTTAIQAQEKIGTTIKSVFSKDLSNVGVGTTNTTLGNNATFAARLNILGAGDNSFITKFVGNNLLLGTINGGSTATLRISNDAGEASLVTDGNVGIGTLLPAASLHVGGTGAILVPVGTTAQAPATAVQGMIRFNTTTNKFEGYEGTAWVALN